MGAWTPPIQKINLDSRVPTSLPPPRKKNEKETSYSISEDKEKLDMIDLLTFGIFTQLL